MNTEPAEPTSERPVLLPVGNGLYAPATQSQENQQHSSSPKCCTCTSLDSWVQPVIQFWQLGPPWAVQSHPITSPVKCCALSPSLVPTTTSSCFRKTHSIWRAAPGFNYSTLLFHLSPPFILVCILCYGYKLLDFWIPLAYITCFNTKRPIHKLRCWLILWSSGVPLPPEPNSQTSMMVSLVCTLYWRATTCKHLQSYLRGISKMVLKGSFLLKRKQAKDGN